MLKGYLLSTLKTAVPVTVLLGLLGTAAAAVWPGYFQAFCSGSF